MRRYIEHIQSKEPHARRQHAAQVAGILTALAFVVWITTLGVRFAGGPATVANYSDMMGGDNTNPQQTQLAGVAVVGSSTDATPDDTPFSNY